MVPEEQALFRRLGAFVGGWTLGAAEAVGDAEGLGLDALEGLESLVDKSLVRVAHGASGEARFGMLETAREYALERLRGRGELESARARHAAHFLALAERAAPELHGAQEAAWRARLEREHDNLRAALRWSSDAGRGEVKLRLVAALAYFWYVHAHIGEALSLARAGGDERASIFPLAFMGKLAWPGGDYERAPVLQEEALALSRAVGDRWREAIVLAELAITRRLQGDDEGAEEILDRSLVLNRQVGNSYHLAQALATLADLVEERGDTARATALLEEGVALSWGSGQRGILAYNLSMTTRLLAEHGDPERAALLLAAGDFMDVLSGWRRTPTEAATSAKALDGVRAKLDGTRLAAASEAGRAMPLERVVDEALAALAGVKAAGTPERPGPVPSRAKENPLSKREREVLRLLAEGLLDRQIAQKLFITERTARSHADSVRRKLKANTRAQAVAIAVRQGLL